MLPRWYTGRVMKEVPQGERTSPRAVTVRVAPRRLIAWISGVPSPRPIFFGPGRNGGSPMTDQPQWKATLGEDSDGNTIVRFSFEGDRGHIQMEAPAGDLDPGDLDGALADQIGGASSHASSLGRTMPGLRGPWRCGSCLEASWSTS